MDKNMDKLKISLQQWLIELYKYKNKQPKDERRILVRYIDGKIETLENVLEEIKKIETEDTYCIDDEVQ